MLSVPWKPYCNAFLGEISSISFDPYTDLLWTANPSGTVVSHFLPSTNIPSDQDRRIARYTSFKSHSYRSLSTQLLIAERGILSLGDKSLKFTNRRGLPHWFISTAFQDAHSIAFTAPKSVELVVGGAQPELVILNTSTGDTVRKLNIADAVSSTLNSIQPPSGFSPITHLRRSQSLMCCGARSGTVTLRDPATLKEEHSMMAHYAGLEQMETEGNYLVTCGYSLKQGHPARDPLVKVFDVRALRPLAPITFSSSPAHVRFHPRMSSTLFISSSIGQLQIIDITHPIPSSSFYQLDVGTFITDMCISSSGDGLVYTEPDGVVHLWSTFGGTDMALRPEEVASRGKPVKWSRGNMPIVLPDPIDPAEPIQWADETPLSSIGMPYYSTELFSVLPYESYITAHSPLYQHKPLLDQDLSIALHQRSSHHPSSNAPNEVFDGGGPKVQYLTNPKKTKRYQVGLQSAAVVSLTGGSATARVGSPAHPHLGLLTPNSRRKLSIPLFRSEQEKEKAKTLINRGKIIPKDTSPVRGESENDAQVSFEISLEDFDEMPKWYRQVEIKYSKFGIEDFDFGFYNNTQYSGLETHIVNSYTNSLLQTLYHTIPVRKVAESHITLPCTTPNCMLCELGFLFKMLDDAQGVNCQTSNFSRVFSINQRAIALELMDHQYQEFCLHQTQIVPRTSDHQTTNGQKIPITSKSYSSLIQLCHHFLLDQISEDASKVSSDHYRFESLRFNPINTQVKTTNSSTSLATISKHHLPSPIADLYTTRWQTNQTCPSCHHQTSRTTFTKVIEMIYPRKALSNEPKPNTDFCSILKNSMIRDTTAKSLCSNCNQYTHQRWRRQPDDLGLGNRALPPVLAINAGVINSEQFEIWLDERAKKATLTNTLPTTATSTFKQLNTAVNTEGASRTHNNQHFLQPEIGISIEGSNEDGNNSRILIGDNHPIQMPSNSIKYELRGLIAQIQSDDETPHLVSLLKVSDHQHTTSISDDEKLDKNTNRNIHDERLTKNDAGGNWYLFNDFLVKKISQEEALSFPACWKVPCVLYYVRKDFDQVLDISKLPSNHLDKSILLKDINLSKCRDVQKIRHEVLTEDELPGKGDLVAIDAEFVSLQQEEVDYKSDGTRLVRRPSQMTLARVSVLRGEGSKTGVPFIDDHIQTFEPITDYLTEYSGIRPGDLDPNTSPHTLVPLKVAYKKLRLLVDLGCIFIGHGLSKDFRIINIHVPPSQIIDTVDIYYIASRQRKLSLRLLSYLILKHDIQNAGTHDSIEDARTALQLYDIYRQLNNEGVWKDEIESVYRKGKDLGWKVPADKSRSPLPISALPPSVTPSKHSKNFSASTSIIQNSPGQGSWATSPALSAMSAPYFPSSGTGGASNSPDSRALQPARQSLSSASLTGEQSVADTKVPTASIAQKPPVSSNFTHNSNLLKFFNQSGAPTTPSNSRSSISSTFERFTSIPPPVFEPKKKAAGFNPMAPSFVHSSSSSSPARTILNLNPNPGVGPSSTYNNYDKKLFNHHASPSHNNNGHPNLPNSSSSTTSSMELFQNNHNQHFNHLQTRTNMNLNNTNNNTNHDFYNFHLNNQHPQGPTSKSQAGIPGGPHAYHHPHSSSHPVPDYYYNPPASQPVSLNRLAPPLYPPDHFPSLSRPSGPTLAPGSSPHSSNTTSNTDPLSINESHFIG